MVEFIVNYMPERIDNVNAMEQQLPDLIKNYSPDKDAMGGYLDCLKVGGNVPMVLLEDDVVLCKDFKNKILRVIAEKKNVIIQFFSMRKKDLTIGSRYEYGRTFCMNQCVYFPKGYGNLIYDYYNDWERKDEHPTAYDYLIADFLKSRRENYYLSVPSLVQHISGKSLIDKRRSSKRQSLTFKEE